MKTSIATVSIAGNFEEKLTAIRDAGYDGLEIFEQDFIAHDAGPAEVGRMIRDQGLEIMLFQPFRDFEGMPPAQRMKAFDRAERKFDLMQALGTDLMLICSNVSPQALGGINRAADDLSELGERAKARGLRIGYEALAWGRHVNDHRDAWEIVRRADRSNVGLILDSFHSLSRKIDPDTIRRIPGDKIFFVQLADAPLIEMDLLYWSRHFRNMPGEGDFPVADFMAAVVSTGYAGPISLEIFNDQFRGGNPKLVARDGYRSLISLMDEVQRTEPDLPVDMDPLPPPITVDGTAFLEFCSRGKEAEALERLLQTLGFQRAGHHVSKKVTLWRQGDVRLLVNRELEGYAASAYAMHGTTVCDIGIAVSDAATTIERATRLGSAPFHQPLGPGELDIPAIRGLGGSLLHFIDEASGLTDLWKIDFKPSEQATQDEGAGLGTVDHIAQTMSYQDMLSWSLFYTALFRMKKAAMIDVIDPDGLVRSQAIKAEGNTLRITLNGADTHRTLAGEFLADSFGASVQHIAMTTADIFSTAQRLTERGFQPLPISTNYYDDLAGRFDLDGDLLSKMRSANILYDRDDGGEFFQLYSPPIGNGMFFEIVERRGAYSGYGAPNAPFRIAAQKRFLRPKGMPRR